MAPTALSALTLLACVAAAASQFVPPPAAMPTAAPTTMPTRAPTKARPTKAPVVARRCTAGPVGTYLDKRSNTCRKCVISTSPFRTIRGRLRCYPPATLSTSSTVCTPAVLPALVRSYTDRTRTTTCINSAVRLSVIYLPVRSSAYSFINAGVYTKAALRLDNSILAQRGRNGIPVAGSVTVRGTKRFQVVFDDRFKTLKRKRRSTVRITGVLRRAGTSIDYCFVSYVKVC